MSGEAVVLASASPRRRELLGALAVAFDVVSPDVSEEAPGVQPARLVEGLALRKARAVAAREEAGERAVIGADTIVVLDGRTLGKPQDVAEARAMLEALRGRVHEVVSGVAVVAGSAAAADHALTRVEMRTYSDEEIDRYVAGGSPLDKAGAYAIQDAAFAPVARFDGCECSVIGLPLWTVRRLLRAAAGLHASPPDLDRCASCPLREPDAS